MKSHFTSALVLLLFTLNLCFSQQGKLVKNIDLSTIKPLKIGDTVPELFFSKILNSPKSAGKLSDFRGKALILDFWFTGCVVCIKQFPKMHTLQSEFKEQLNIVPVGFELSKEGEIEQFMTKNKGTVKELLLPTIVQTKRDSLIRLLFPANELPLEVWIDQNGVLRAITDHRALTTQNLRTFLSNQQNFVIPTKKRLTYIDCTKEFLIKKEGETPVFGTLFSGYIDTVANLNYWGRQCDSNYVRLFEANNTLHGFYYLAYQNIFPELADDPYKKRIRINSYHKKYEDFFIASNYDNWQHAEFRKNHCYCFELILPNTYTLEGAYQYLRSEIDHYFRLSSNIKIVKEKCLVLKLKPGKTPKTPIIRTANGPIKFRNMKDAVYLLNSVVKDKLVINETGMPLDSILPAELNRNSSLQANIDILNAADFELVEEERELKLLIVSDLIP